MKAYAEVLRLALELNGCAVTLVAPRRILGGGMGEGGIKKWLGYIDKYVFFSVELIVRSMFCSRVHICDHSNAMYSLALFWRKVSVTCHDVIAIQAALGMTDTVGVGRFGKVLQAFVLRGLKSAWRVVCVSTLTERDFSALASRKDGVCVVHNPLNFDFFEVSSGGGTVLGGTPLSRFEPFMLHVGSALPRKNRGFVVYSWLKLRNTEKFRSLRLVMVGPALDSALVQDVDKAGASAGLFVVQDVSSEELRSLYSCAELFMFPSLSEGFGWPVAEAQACGCPVFASNVEPMPEVGGAAAAYFSPHDVDQAVRCVLEADFALMRSAGLENVKRFNPEVFAKRMIDEIG